MQDETGGGQRMRERERERKKERSKRERKKERKKRERERSTTEIWVQIHTRQQRIVCFCSCPRLIRIQFFFSQFFPIEHVFPFCILHCEAKQYFLFEFQTSHSNLARTVFSNRPPCHGSFFLCSFFLPGGHIPAGQLQDTSSFSPALFFGWVFSWFCLTLAVFGLTCCYGGKFTNFLMAPTFWETRYCLVQICPTMWHQRFGTSDWRSKFENLNA